PPTYSLLVTTPGFRAATPEAESDFLERTLAAIGRNRQQPPAATSDEWRAVSERLISYRGRLDEQLDWLGMPLSVGGVLVTRAFETWLHTDDIRLATGRPRQAPSP